MRKYGKVLLVVLALIVLAIATTFLIPQPPAPPPPVLPNPNGYDQFLKAGGMITDQRDFTRLTHEELRALVQDNSNALAIARIGLQQQSRVPVRFSEDFSTDHAIRVRRLAQLIAAEGRLAELDKSPDRAAVCYLDVIHLGNEASRGGVLLHAMIGIAIESLGADCLSGLTSQLNAPSCRHTAKALEALDAQRQTWSDVLTQEDEWVRRTYPGVRGKLGILMTRSLTKDVKDSAEKNFKERQTKTRHVLIDLAARAYELEKGKRPASTADLVPDYLKAVPQDPYTRTDMTYLP